MRTTEHKTHIVDNVIEEIKLLNHTLWGQQHQQHGGSIVRTDLFNVRKDTLEYLSMLLSEARRRLNTYKAEQ